MRADEGDRLPVERQDRTTFGSTSEVSGQVLKDSGTFVAHPPDGRHGLHQLDEPLPARRVEIRQNGAVEDYDGRVGWCCRDEAWHRFDEVSGQDFWRFGSDEGGGGVQASINASEPVSRLRTGSSTAQRAASLVCVIRRVITPSTVGLCASRNARKWEYRPTGAPTDRAAADAVHQ